MDVEKVESIIRQHGFDDFKWIVGKDVEVRQWVRFKCMFGCADWGKGHTCPSSPGSLKPWEYRRIFEEYSWGCIVHSTSKKVSQDVSFALEREAFLDGHHFAFSMSDCAICGECAGFKGRPCVDPRRARPAFHSVGIDVFATVRQFDLPLLPLKSEDDPQNWYSAVFVE